MRPLLVRNARALMRGPSLQRRVHVMSSNMCAPLSSMVWSIPSSTSTRARAFASNNSAPIGDFEPSCDAQTFHREADDLLEGLQDTIESELERLEVEEFDVSLESGVLTIEVPYGTYVINKQTPNRQIWWSSPLSGPKRFFYDVPSGAWLYARDGKEQLLGTLEHELSEHFKATVTLQLRR